MAVLQDPYRACTALRNAAVPLNRGYATAGTDAGHQETGGKWGIGVTRKKWSTSPIGRAHEMTLESCSAAKYATTRILSVSLFFQARLDRRAHGGHGGAALSRRLRRYRRGALANRHIRMWAAGIAASVEFDQAPRVKRWSKEQVALVNDLVTKACDVRHEGFLNDPRECKSQFRSPSCQRGNRAASASSTEPELKTVTTFYTGVKNSERRDDLFGGATMPTHGFPRLPIQTGGPDGLFR